MADEYPDCPEAMHQWFGLSYANYLAIPRVLIQSMSDEWQSRLARLLGELQEATRGIEQAPQYRVHATDESGRYMRDPLPHYRRDRMAAYRVELAIGQRRTHPQPPPPAPTDSRT